MEINEILKMLGEYKYNYENLKEELKKEILTESVKLLVLEQRSFQNLSFEEKSKRKYEISDFKNSISVKKAVLESIRKIN